jgi:hypothetical protein
MGGPDAWLCFLPDDSQPMSSAGLRGRADSCTNKASSELGWNCVRDKQTLPLDREPLSLIGLAFGSTPP